MSATSRAISSGYRSGGRLFNNNPGAQREVYQREQGRKAANSDNFNLSAGNIPPKRQLGFDDIRKARQKKNPQVLWLWRINASVPSELGATWAQAGGPPANDGQMATLELLF